MEFFDNSLAILFKMHYGALSLRLQEYEQSFTNKKLFILITGDKYYDYGVTIKKKDNSNPYGYITPEYNSEIKAINKKLFSIIESHNYKKLYGLDFIRDFATFNSESKITNLRLQIPQIKVRLLNTNNEIFYEHLPNLYFKDGHFFISNSKAKWEKVRYAGLYLGIRDRNGERVYEGDIVLAKAKKDRGSGRFWGLAFEFINGNYYSIPKNPIDKVFLEHGGNYLPSYLSWAEEFEVEGNFFEISTHNFIESHEYSYMYDYRPFEELCENRARELGWKG